MRHLRNVVLTCGLLLVTSIESRAESWRGIVPLRSTKTDVERLLGKPSEATDKMLTYESSSEIALISVITADASNPQLRSFPLGTVKDIQVIPKNRYLADLGLDEQRQVFIKGSKPEYLGFQGYVDLEAGLIVKTNGRNIERIFYFANSKDRVNCPSCAIDPQTIADVPICELCPTVSVTCPDEIEHGNAVSFTVNVTMGTPITPISYSWTVTGGKIVEGQGTDYIKVDSTGLQGKSITATVEVNGIDPACNRTASCTTTISRKP